MVIEDELSCAFVYPAFSFWDSLECVVEMVQKTLGSLQFDVFMSTIGTSLSGDVDDSVAPGLRCYENCHRWNSKSLRSPDTYCVLLRSSD